MNYELTIYELGKLLKDISIANSLKILIKTNLSGGIATMVGDVSIDYIPSEKNSPRGNNIIGLKISNIENSACDFKITGLKEHKFNVEITSTKYKEVNRIGLSLNKLKENTDECKIKVDNNLIFTVDASLDSLKELLN